MMEFFAKNLLSILAKNSIIDIWLGSKYAFDTFVKFFIIYGLFYIIMDFYMTPGSYLILYSLPHIIEIVKIKVSELNLASMS